MATLSTVREQLRYCIRFNRPAFVWGGPGIGKTDTGEGAFADEGMPCLTETLGTMESVDLRGLPFRDGDSVKWSMPDFLARLWQMSKDNGGPCGLFIDEANANAQSLQVPLMQLALKRRIGPHALPPECRVIFAGNRLSDRAAAQRMPTALANRLTHLHAEPDLKGFLAWAASVNLHPVVCALLMLRGEGTPHRPGLLYQFDATKDEAAFPSPRSWAQAAPFFDAPDSIRFGLVAGTVGEGAAAEAEGFLKIYKNLPPIVSIIANPTNSPVPSDPSTQYAVAVALSRAANPANFAAVLQYMGRVGREFQIVTATDAVRRNPGLAETPAWIHWAAANSDVTI